MSATRGDNETGTAAGHGEASTDPDALLAALRARLRPDQIDTSESSLALFSHGESYSKGRKPDVVVYPESTEDVREVVLVARHLGVAITPVGANSSLEGHTVPVRGGISLNLSRMDRIREIVADDFLVVVEPGVTYPRLNEALRSTGLFFPIDPGAEATLGGMASTNASGTMAVKYGVTADLVMALEVVLANGEVIRTGGRSRKSTSGYALTKLFCGAEGTLGIITELTVKVVARPVAVVGLRASFATIGKCVDYVTELIQSGASLSRCELVDAASIEAINRHLGMSLEPAPTVFLELGGDLAVVESMAREASEVAAGHGATVCDVATGGEELSRLWKARHQAFYCMVAVNPGLANIITDLAVPISRLAEVIEACTVRVRDAGMPAYVLGHVGDGNFHLTLFFPPDDEAAEERAHSVHAELVEITLAAGGTCTAEHGVGLRKLRYVRKEHGAAVDTMWAIKRALDPQNIMNPDKKLPA